MTKKPGPGAKGKFMVQGVKCMFVGYAADHAGNVYRIKTKRVLITRDISWFKVSKQKMDVESNVKIEWKGDGEKESRRVEPMSNVEDTQHTTKRTRTSSNNTTNPTYTKRDEKFGSFQQTRSTRNGR